MNKENLKIGDLCLYSTYPEATRFEIVSVSAVSEKYYHVRHLDEEGSWIAYPNNIKLQDNLLKIYRTNALNEKITSLRVKEKLGDSTDLEEIEHNKKILEKCKYEKNFVDADFTQFSKLFQ